MKIDSRSVDNSLKEIEKTHDLLQKTINLIDSASSNLDVKISGKIYGFSLLKKTLETACSNSKMIIEKSDDFISSTTNAVLTISGISSILAENELGQASENFTQDNRNSVLNMCKGPLNKEFIDNPEEYVQELNRQRMQEELSSKGLTDKDIERVLNGEISVEELFNEITSDKDRTRYRMLMEAQYLQGYDYSASETQAKLDSLKSEKNDLESRLNEINSTVTDSISDKDLYAEQIELENKIKKLNRQIIDITQLVNGYGNTDIHFTSMKELNASILECQNKIKELTVKMNKANAAKYEQQLFNNVVDNILFNDATVEKAMSSVVAYSYVDSYGNEIYDFDIIGAYGKGDSVKLLTYADIYGDSVATAKLMELMPKGDDSTNHSQDYYTKIIDIKNYFNENQDNYFKGNMYDNREVNAIKQELSEEAHRLAIYSGIKENIDTNINYYFENIDSYINLEDFDKYSSFNGDYNLLDDLNALDGLYDKYCNKGDNDSSISNEEVISGYKEYTGLILSYIINSSANIDDDNYVHDDYAVGLSYPAISLLGTTSSFKENAIDYCRKWRKIMTENEVAAFNYICNTKGYEAGYDYLVDILPTLDKRYVQNEQQKDAEWAHDNPVLASIGSIFKKPLEGIGGAFYSIGCLANGVKIRMSNTYSTADTWRGTVSTDISILNGETAAFFYNTGMSIADTGLVITLTTLTGGAGSFVFSTGVMGSSVYLSTLNEALERGLDDKHAVALALGSAAIESIMENYSVGHLMGLEKEFDEVLKNSVIMDKIVSKLASKGVNSQVATNLLAFAYCALDQAFVEGDEELWTEIANNWWDCTVAGVLNDKDLSKKAVYIENYKKEHPGCSEAEAYASQFGNVMKDSGLAWVGGATSGIFFGIGKGSSTVKSNNATYRMYNQFLNQQVNMMQSAMLKAMETTQTQEHNEIKSVDLKMPDEILESYMKEGMDKYSHYDLKVTLDKSDSFFYRQYNYELLKQYLELAPTQESQKVLSEILLNGGYNGFGFDSDLCSHNNRDTELARRLSMASMYLTNPKTFMSLAQNGINMFHGTSSSVLSDILENGLKSVDTIEQSGGNVSTGEYASLNSVIDMHSTIRGRNFISFTDVFDLAYLYAPNKDNGTFSVIIGTTAEDINSSEKTDIYSDLIEVGVKGDFSIDKIKTLIVPGDKVELVKKMVGDRDIEVLSMDGYDKKPFYYYDDLQFCDNSIFDSFAQYAKDIFKTDNIDQKNNTLNVVGDAVYQNSISAENSYRQYGDVNQYTAEINLPNKISNFKLGDSLTNILEKISNGIVLKLKTAIPEISLKKAVNNGLLNEKNMSDEYKNSLKKILKGLYIKEYIDSSKIETFNTPDGFDYGSFLQYLLERIGDQKIKKLLDFNLSKLFDIKNAKQNPKEALGNLMNKISYIRNLINENMKSEEIENILTLNNFNYLNFIANYLARNRDYRVENGDILKAIAEQLWKIGELRIEAKANPSLTYKGVEIKLYGDDNELLKTSLQRILQTIDKLPDALRKQASKIKIYDSEYSGNLMALFNNPKYYNDKNTYAFVSGGNYWRVDEAIRIFKNSLKGTDKWLYELLSHELSHTLDFHIAKVFTNNNNKMRYFTDMYQIWEKAKKADGLQVSSYGSTLIQEDFAEMSGKILAPSLIKGPMSLEKIKANTIYRHRNTILKALYDIMTPESLDIQRKIELLRLFKDNLTEEENDDKKVTSNIFKTLFNDLKEIPCSDRVNFIIENKDLFNNEFLNGEMISEFLDGDISSLTVIQKTEILELLHRFPDFVEKSWIWKIYTDWIHGDIDTKIIDILNEMNYNYNLSDNDKKRISLISDMLQRNILENNFGNSNFIDAYEFFKICNKIENDEIRKKIEVILFEGIH